MNTKNQKLVVWDDLTIEEKNEVTEAVSVVLLGSSTMFKCCAMILNISLASLNTSKAIMPVMAGRREIMDDIGTQLMLHHALSCSLMLMEINGNNNPLITKLEEIFGKYNVNVKSSEDFFIALRGVSEHLVIKELGVSDEGH